MAYATIAKVSRLVYYGIFDIRVFPLSYAQLILVLKIIIDNVLKKKRKNVAILDTVGL